MRENINKKSNSSETSDVQGVGNEIPIPMYPYGETLSAYVPFSLKLCKFFFVVSKAAQKYKISCMI